MATPSTQRPVKRRRPVERRPHDRQVYGPNISSAAATLGSPGTYVHYSAAKAAVDAMTGGLSKEVAAEGVRVNCVAPGTIWTDFHAVPQRPAKIAEITPMGRAGKPEEIAGAVAWLLSDDASYATGTVMRIAGGM